MQPPLNQLGPIVTPQHNNTCLFYQLNMKTPSTSSQQIAYNQAPPP